MEVECHTGSCFDTWTPAQSLKLPTLERLLVEEHIYEVVGTII